MAGALMALVGEGGASGGANGGSPAAVSWTAIYDTDVGSTNTQTLSGFTGALSISAAVSSGPVMLGYQQNGANHSYAGAFTVSPGDTLSWSIGVGHSAKSGTLTVSYGAGPTTLATIPYSVDSSWDGTGYR